MEEEIKEVKTKKHHRKKENDLKESMHIFSDEFM